jgi:predicted nucleic acid-binding Zn ribbon protein
MKVHLPEHSHCLACGDPVPANELYCSEECRQEQEAKKRKNKQRNLLFYIVAIVAIVAVWIYSYVL